MAMNTGLRSCVSRLTNSTIMPKSEFVKRGIHSTSVKKMGGHGRDEPDYVHARNMYNLDHIRHRKLKMRLAVFTAFSIGVFVPIYAVVFQQKKASSA